MEDKNELKQTEAVEENGEAVKSDSSKKNTLKNLLQLVIFILLSMAGFIVQMIIEQISLAKSVKEFDAVNNFIMFGIKYGVGSFIISMIAIFICKVINFVLHRKVLFKPRSNLAFGIAMYVVFSVVLWLGSVSIKQPVEQAFVNADWWTNGLFKGNAESAAGVANFLAVMVYSTADLIIMFFAEKFLIMNDKLFVKKGEAVDGEIAEEIAADSVVEVKEDEKKDEE